jgi:ABC-2 type transport system permease protein
VTALPAPAVLAEISPRRTSSLRRLAHQLRFEAIAAGRNPVYLGFTLAMPLTMLAIFSLLLSAETVGPLALTYREFLVPNVVVLGLLSSCFASVGIGLAIRRGTGELKRLRGTPLPPWVTLAALGCQAAALGILATIAVAAAGRFAFGVQSPALVPLGVVVAVAAPSLAALGIAIGTFIHRPQNGPAVTNLAMWPVAFISGTFTWVNEGSALHRISSMLPVRHLNDAALAAFPAGGGSVATTSLAVVAAWGVLGAVIATRRFSWEPSRTT